MKTNKDDGVHLVEYASDMLERISTTILAHGKTISTELAADLDNFSK